MHEPVYDLRVVLACMKAALGIEEISPTTLPTILLSSPPVHQLEAFLNALPQPEL